MEAADVVTETRDHSGSDGEPVIVAEGIAKSYGRQAALRGVGISVPRGRAYGLIGPDGAGKSTLMKILSGVLAQDDGSFSVFGTEVDSERSAEPVKARLGFMPQGLGQNLYRELSVEENVDFFARLRSVPADELAERKRRLYDMTRLDRFRHRPMKQLSGGMKQKLGLVCTLIHEPDLVVLDEPTTGVDPVSRRDFWAILADLMQDGGLTALISTAYMDEAARFQRFAFLYRGRVLLEGSPGEVRERAEGSAVSLSTDEPLAALDRLQDDFGRVEAYGERLRVFVPDADADEARDAVRSSLGDAADRIRELDATEGNLEDVFVTLLQREREESEEEPGRRSTPEVAFSGERHRDEAAQDDDRVAVRARGLVKEFGDFRAVDDVSLDVSSGEIFGLLGANGAGKTTVIKMLTGILRSTSGEARVAGRDLRHASRAVKERVGYMSQSFSLYEDLTVEENIRLYAGVYGLGRRRTREHLRWVLGATGLERRRTTRGGALPVGLRQRLALGCALVHQPRILFLDEPTSGVDPIGRRQFWDLLFRLSRREQVAMLVTTHYMQEAEHCDRLALMFAGRIIADGTPDEMRSRVEEEGGALLEIRVDRPLAAVERLRDEGWEGVSLYGDAVHLLAPDPDAAGDRIRSQLDAAGVGVEEIGTRRPSMEDVFVYRTLQSERDENDGRRAA